MEDTLLLVDNHDMLQFLSKDLGEDYLVFTARNEDEALNILAIQSIRIIICAVRLPELNGFNLCNRLKTSLKYSHVPIILLTSENTLQSKIDGLKAGADAYIENPFIPEHLKAQISNLLNNRNKIKAYFAHSPLAHMGTMAYSRTDETFLHTLNDLIHGHMDNPALSADLLARLMNISRPTLYRKIRDMSDLTPNELVNVARLKKAAELLMHTNCRIFEVAMMVGFNSQSSFGKAFLKQFRVRPTEFQLAARLRNIEG
jgi:two-component system, cell cycle response regulator